MGGAAVNMLIENAAKASFEARLTGRSRMSIPRLGIEEIAKWGDLSEDMRERERIAVRAALKTLLPATSDMTEVALCDTEDAVTIWEQMMAEVLR